MALLTALSAALLSATLSGPFAPTLDSPLIDASGGGESTGGGSSMLSKLLLAQAGGQVLEGFDTVLLTQINTTFGSENLPVAGGSPVSPGVYVTVSNQQLMVFDEKIADLQDGSVPPGPASRECKSGCKALLWTGFRRMWLRALDEATTYTLEVPSRVLFATEASLPAHTLVELSYAIAETRPGGAPTFGLLVNAGNAGLRVRQYFLLPPGGLRVAPGDSVLGLRVTLGGGESFVIEAANPRFSPTVQGSGWKDLAAHLAHIKKRYPNKKSLIIDVGEQASTADLAMVMTAAKKHFPRVVLTDGGDVSWG